MFFRTMIRDKDPNTDITKRSSDLVLSRQMLRSTDSAIHDESLAIFSTNVASL